MANTRSDSGAGIEVIRAAVAVIGAGPAGLAAAVAAADAGASVALIDAESGPGGQFWRHPAPATGEGRVRPEEIAHLHHQLGTYQDLCARLERHRAAGQVTSLARHEVWALERTSASAGASSAATVDTAQNPADPTADGPISNGPRFTIHVVTGAAAGRRGVRIDARSVVLAPGAFDLQVPFPGWDLPGVMTAGGAQSLLKGHGVLPGRRVVVAGTGPFLLSVAAGLLRCGAAVPAVVELARPGGWAKQATAIPGVASKLVEGAAYAATLLRHRTAYRTGWTVTAAEATSASNGALGSVVIAPVDGQGRPDHTRAERIDADVLAVGWGFVPQLELPLMLGCATAPGVTGLPCAVVDGRQRGTVPGVYLAGEVCGVGGAELALVEGELAGSSAARELERHGAAADFAGLAGRADRRQQLRDRYLARRRSALRRFASALAAVYPLPRAWPASLPDDVVVCRCEEVRAGQIRQAAIRDGALDARAAKLLTRAGMGYCQGRICGYGVDCLAGEVSGSGPRLSASERPVATPIPLALVAADPPAANGAMDAMRERQ